tara:strand:- start:1575 stop:2159 length:585 start_codon:yes stop_codon:yes gene_type:complete
MTTFVKSPAPFIHLYDIGDVEPFLDALITAADATASCDWRRATTGGPNGVFMHEVRTSLLLDLEYLLFLNQDSPLSELWTKLHTPIWDNLNHYCSQHDLKIKALEGWGINRYEMGAEYHQHPDKGAGNSRVLSVIVYLNSVEGGETVFPEWDAAIRPEPGRMLVFPSSYPWQHVALPPDEGAKYSLVTWFHNGN